MLGLIGIFFAPPASAASTMETGVCGQGLVAATLPLTVIMIADNVMSRSGPSRSLGGQYAGRRPSRGSVQHDDLDGITRMAVLPPCSRHRLGLFRSGGPRWLGNRSAARRLAYHFSAHQLRAIPLPLLTQPLLAVFGPFDFVARRPDRSRSSFSARCSLRMRTSTAPCHDDRTRAHRRSDACRMRRFELRRLHPDDRFARMTGAALARTATLIAWNVAMGVFVYRRLHLMPGLVTSFKAIPGKKCAADRGI